MTTHDLVIPAGTRVARIALFDEFTDGNHDLDLWLANPAGTLIAVSANETSEEVITLSSTSAAGLAAGTYKVYVHGFQTDGPSANFTLFGWTLNADGLGTLAPTSLTASIGSEHTITLTGGALTPGARYLGEVTYNQAGTLGFPVRTLITGKAT